MSDQTSFFRGVPEWLTCHQVNVGDVPIGANAPLVLIAGPCVIESESHVLMMASELRKLCERLNIPLIFKASFDKANRTSLSSYRGPGLDEGLRILQKAKDETGAPVLSDIHEKEQALPAAEVCDILQIPAFLCRQTDLLIAAARTGKPVNVKKGQFLAPWDMSNVVAKLRDSGCEDIVLTERGASFGYGTLVSDFRAISTMRELTGLPVCFDATHSVQQPGGLGSASGGQRQYVPLLSRAACAAGVNALFMEVHDDPENAKSDGPNMLPLSELEPVLKSCCAIDRALRSWNAGESENG